ncbi:MAG TPA: hypothetical protein VGR43_04505 [Dehalococcoidia bacterium]|nr:hypothetical protein [Dehalococcoidia bacterium]
MQLGVADRNGGPIGDCGEQALFGVVERVVGGVGNGEKPSGRPSRDTTGTSIIDRMPSASII